jgi:ribosomal protein L11 methyltransferase
VTYVRLAVTPSDPARRDAVSAALFAAGAGGLLEDGPTFVTVFDDSVAALGAERAARAVDESAVSACEPYEPGDYTREWRLGVRAHRVGRLVITPPWLASTFDPRESVIIEPATGFGTGEHESTRTTLALVQRVVRAGDIVADAGAGSGVLAIAAVRLGAARVAAIEIDPQAISNAETNIALNGVADRVTLIEGDAAYLLPLLAPVRVVAANIIASVLLELLPAIDQAVAAGGDVVVGGLLVTERDAFARDALRAGWRVAAEETAGAWWSGHLRRAAE